MGSKKFNWNKILNNFIAGIGLILACLFIGMCFIVPASNTRANALTKEDILNYGISFNSAKTRIRTAKSYNKVVMYDRDNSPFNAYTYDYNRNQVESTKLYSTVKGLKDELYGNVSLTTDGTTLNTYKLYSNGVDGRPFSTIPSDVDYFYNELTGNMEEIFYDEIDNGDFVLLSDNYKSNVTNGNNFNVENFYLSFGSPYDSNQNNESTSTLLADLRVTGTLRNSTGLHNIVLNEAETTDISTINSLQAHSWNQYFDLNELYGYKTAETSTDQYAIQDLQGRYDITFYFIRYAYSSTDNTYTAVSNAQESFTYTFYLLDNENYNKIPNINNATLGNLEKNQPKEYFFNFTGENPYLSYNPSAFNISYDRINKEINDSITSTYTSTTYSLSDGHIYPLNIINYYNNSNLLKQVYILTYFNENKTVVEYLYLANLGSALNLNTYDSIKNAIDNDQLKFEYKVSKELVVTQNGNETKYEINTYNTTSFAKYEIGKNLWDDENKATDTYLVQAEADAIDSTKTNYTYYKNSIKNENKIAEIYNYEKSFEKTDLTNTESKGIVINTSTLADSDADELKTEDASIKILDGDRQKYLMSSKYQLITTADNTTFIEKKYITGELDSESKYIVSTASINLNTTLENGTYKVIDPINKSISIEYTLASHDITSIKFKNNNYTTAALNADANTLSYILNIDTLPTNEIMYNLVFDDLGEYTFDYKYSLAVYNNISLISENTINNSTNSTNILSIKDFTTELQEKTTDDSSASTTKDVYITISGYFDQNQTVNLGGDTYSYTRQGNNISLKVNNKQTYNMNSIDTRTFNCDAGSVPFGDPAKGTTAAATFTIRTDAQGVLYLEVSFFVGTIKINSEKVTFESKLNGHTVNNTTTSKTNLTKEETIETKEYTVTVHSSTIADETNKPWSCVVSLLELLETNNVLGFNSKIFTHTESYSNMSSDKLHIFGSITYFNKEDNSTDSEYAKLQYSNVKTNENYNADITKYISTSGNLTTSTTPDLKGIVSRLCDANLFNANDIIVTDVAPVLWKNYSSLLYKYSSTQPESYIYRYPNYSIESDGKLNYGTECITSFYTKDIYCQFDGLYEIVVFYKYDGFKTFADNTTYNYDTTIFYQVFTFIIDNSSPALSIKVQDSDGNYTEELGLNKFTNKNIQLSWEAPTHFKNNVYVELQNTTYSNSDSSQSFVATYFDGNISNPISTLSGSSTYINAVTRTNITREVDAVSGKIKQYYNVVIHSDDYMCNGNYKVILHYSTGGKSTVTQEFTIDKQNITGLKTLPIKQDENGKYYINEEKNHNDQTQIVNFNFTFRYNSKPSKANIYTYWYKIELDKAETNEYDQILETTDKKTAITTTFKINGRSTSTIGNQYIYNYSTGKNVASNNCFVNTNSAIYLFYLVDDAGNECRYVIFYDNTTPRFVISPTLDNSFNIINSTTKVTWGNYKAILIETPTNDYELSTATKVNNYMSELDSQDVFKEALLYINTLSATNFNNTKLQSIEDNYYLLLPINDISMKDISSNGSNSQYFDNSTDLGEYYFFPHDPISPNGESIILPTDITKPNSPTSEYKISSYNYAQVLDSYNKPMDRFLRTTGDTALNGAVGAGEYEFNITDKQGNFVSGYLWLNLDKTQVMGFGIFNKTSDDINKAVPLTGNEGSYSASKLFISSLAAKEDQTIPDYTLTYQFYALNYEFYKNLNNLNIESITLIDKNNASSYGLSLVDKQTIMQIVYKSEDPATTTSTTTTINIDLTNELGEPAPLHSYPYDPNPLSVVSDSSGNPEHIYNRNKNIYEEVEDDSTRYYSKTINPTADANGAGNIVTQEGLYIFTRKYTSDDVELGDDSKIIYRIYYIDRTNIINITTTDSIAQNLSEIAKAQTFGYTLGYGYSDATYQKYISANNIKNAQKTSNSNNSNIINEAYSLFTTNKVQVQFNVTADKYNYDSFTNAFKSNLIKELDAKEDFNETKSLLSDGIQNYLFNDTYYSKFYDIKLTISTTNPKDNTDGIIINESSMNQNDIYDTININKYLKYSGVTDYSTVNYYNFFLDPGNYSYYITIKDSSGYRLKDDDGVITDNNYLANELDMSFKISQSAPEGDAYGKYYGRHDYDESSSSYHSLPFEKETIDGTEKEVYALLSKYLKEGQLDSLSLNFKETPTQSSNGQYVKLYSTNNESLIFTFSITQDDYMAQIDPNNIQIYKGSIDQNNLIFNRINGYMTASNLVTADRMTSSFIRNTIDGVTYYAIIVFDNNLDQILDENEIDSYGNYRLLDSIQNIDQETYYIKINYVGDASNYVNEDNNSYASTTYEITIDRNKPVYNLAKLMEQDKYVYNPITDTVTDSNFESVFEKYKQYYKFGQPNEEDIENNFDRSYLENYFFAVDYRPASSFEFKSVSELDSSGGIYIRLVNKKGYKFSITPDDYKAYYEATYLAGHPQFTPSRAIINNGDIKITDQNTYYQIPFDVSNEESQDNTIKLSYLVASEVLSVNNYYEIIECDEAGNYRVYAIYLPDYTQTKVSYSYKSNSTASKNDGTISSNSTTRISVSGVDFALSNIITKDAYMKADIKVTSKNLTETISVIYDPFDECIYVKNSANNNIDVIENITLAFDNKDFVNSIITDEFVKTINYYINDYNDKISSKDSSYYTQYGYTIQINFVDRIGLASNIAGDNGLYDYEITYNVAGSILSPTFTNGFNSFNMIIPAMTGTTYITKVKAFKFNNGWIEKDPDDRANSFSKTASELMKGAIYTLNRGVYKFIITDNFNRENSYFYEYGTSSTQAGGSLRYTNSYITYSDEYTYTSSRVEFAYDNSLYDIFIKFEGTTLEGEEFTNTTDLNRSIVYSSKTNRDDPNLRQYGISVATIDSLTTITFSGVSELSKYHIKTIPASISEQYGYEWDMENSNNINANNMLVYDKKVAIYTAMPEVVIKNLNGNILNSNNDEPLNLTEDFEVTLQWSNKYDINKQIDFNNRIVLVRTYTENNVVMPTETISNASSYIITKTGEYVAYIINDLNNRSESITFSRGKGEITMYSVLNVNKSPLSETKLNPSTYVDFKPYADDAITERNIILFNYFTTQNYFSFKSISTGASITIADIIDSVTTINVTDITIDKTSAQYLDVKVNSNLSIMTELYDIAIDSGYPYVSFRIFSSNTLGESYTYRLVRIYFLPTNEQIVETSVSNNSSEKIFSTSNDNNENFEPVSVLKRPDATLFIDFDCAKNNNSLKAGNTIYIDRYYNNALIETLIFTDPSDFDTLNGYIFRLSQVGVYKFVIRDLAGRTQTFGQPATDNTTSTLSTSFSIYLINQILFTVNDKEPINNQIFNGSVTIDIISSLDGLSLYNTNTLGITVTKNGVTTTTNSRALEFSDAGYYTIKLAATTMLSDDSSIADQEISSTYNFVIVKTNVAQRSFNVSKGTGFVIDKLIKIVNGEREEITNKYESTDSLLWLTYENEGNSIFEVTMKYFNSNTKEYQDFTFNVWINNDTPVILSSIDEGTSTKNTIVLSFNPGIIYTQVGKCQILINDKVYMDIDENSNRVVNEIQISQKGTYIIKIVSEDGTLISSYKYTKTDPLNKTTQIVLICVAIGVVILVAVFFLIRRKGKYR